MKILGAEAVPVKSGTATLKDAMNEAMRYWVSSVRDTFYVIGTTAGPNPYPLIVRDFQLVIGRETKKQIQKLEGRNPDVLIACVGGGSNAMGTFYPFRNEKNIAMYGVEAAGHGLNTSEHSASINGGKVGVLHGNKTYLLQDEHGQVRDAYSIAAGLDYPGVGPEHAYFHAIKKVKYVTVTDKERSRRQLCQVPATGRLHSLGQRAFIQINGYRREGTALPDVQQESDLWVAYRGIDIEVCEEAVQDSVEPGARGCAHIDAPFREVIQNFVGEQRLYAYQQH